MTVTILDDLPVLLNTIDSEFSIADDWAWAEAEMRRILDTHPEPLFAIDDIRDLTVSLGDVLHYATLGSRSDNAIWRHPRLLGMYFISGSKLVEMAASGLGSATFGLTSAKAFATVEEALEDIRQNLTGP